MDNVLEYVYVDGAPLHSNAVSNSFTSSNNPGSHDGATLSVSFSSDAQSMVIKGWDWEKGCGSGGVNVNCWSVSGNTVWDSVDISQYGVGSDIPNWRVLSLAVWSLRAPSTPLDAPRSRGST